jgi:hypothetical protein
MSLVWTCNDIEAMTAEIMVAYDSNGDNHLNPEDTDMDPEMYDMFITACDYNNDGTVDDCEIHACLV